MAMKLTESEKKLDNTLRSINKHLNEVFKTFGGNSYEYEKAQSVVKSKLKDSVFRMPEYNDSGEMIKPIQIGRSRTALNALKSQTNEVNEVRQFEIYTEQSAKTQATKYYERLKEELAKKGETPTAQQIKEFSTTIHHNSFNDIYKDVVNNTDIPDFEKGIFRGLTRVIHTEGLEQAEQYGQNLLAQYDTTYINSLGDESDYASGAESFDINQLP